MTNQALPRCPIEPLWFDAIETRASRRYFDGRPVGSRAALRIGGVCRSISSAPDVAYLELADSERVVAVSPLGYGTTNVPAGERLLRAVMKPRARLDLE